MSLGHKFSKTSLIADVFTFIHFQPARVRAAASSLLAFRYHVSTHNALFYSCCFSLFFSLYSFFSSLDIIFCLAVDLGKFILFMVFVVFIFLLLSLSLICQCLHFFRYFSNPAFFFFCNPFWYVDDMNGKSLIFIPHIMKFNLFFTCFLFVQIGHFC